MVLGYLVGDCRGVRTGRGPDFFYISGASGYLMSNIVLDNKSSIRLACELSLGKYMVDIFSRYGLMLLGS